MGTSLKENLVWKMFVAQPACLGSSAKDTFLLLALTSLFLQLCGINFDMPYMKSTFFKQAIVDIELVWRRNLPPLNLFIGKVFVIATNVSTFATRANSDDKIVP
jgi:hypothetical protein